MWTIVTTIWLQGDVTDLVRTGTTAQTPLRPVAHYLV